MREPFPWPAALPSKTSGLSCSSHSNMRVTQRNCTQRHRNVEQLRWSHKHPVCACNCDSAAPPTDQPQRLHFRICTGSTTPTGSGCKQWGSELPRKWGGGWLQFCMVPFYSTFQESRKEYLKSTCLPVFPSTKKNLQCTPELSRSPLGFPQRSQAIGFEPNSFFLESSGYLKSSHIT